MQIKTAIAYFMMAGFAYADQAPAGLMTGSLTPTAVTPVSTPAAVPVKVSPVAPTPTVRSANTLPATPPTISAPTAPSLAADNMNDDSFANGAVTPPEVINVSDNNKYTVELSSTDPNRVTVQGDKITDITCPSGACYVKNLQNDATGSAYISVLNNSSFTAFVSTASNRHFSLWVMPTDEPGKTLVFNPLNGAMGVAGKFEKSTDYEDLLVNLTEDMEKGHIPDGYGVLDLTAQKPFSLANGLSVQPVSAMTGSYVSGLHFTLKNTTPSPLSVTEELFNHGGVRSISIQGGLDLPPGGTSELYEIVSNPNV